MGLHSWGKLLLCLKIIDRGESDYSEEHSSLLWYKIYFFQFSLYIKHV
jgi:hypothetical protein